MIVELLLVAALAVIAFLYARPLVYSPAIDAPLAWIASSMLCVAAATGLFLQADFSLAFAIDLPFSRGIVPSDQMGLLFNAGTFGALGSLFLVGAAHFFSLWRSGDPEQRVSILAQMAFLIAAGLACVSGNLLLVLLYIEIALTIGALIGALFQSKKQDCFPRELNRYLSSRVIPLLAAIPMLLFFKVFGSFHSSGVLSIGLICYAFSVLGLEGVEEGDGFGVTFFMVRSFLMIIVLVHALGQFNDIPLELSFSLFFVALLLIYGLWVFVCTLAESNLEKGFDHWQRLAIIALAIEILVLNLDSKNIRLTYFGFLAAMMVARVCVVRAEEPKGFSLFVRVAVFSLLLILFEHPEVLGFAMSNDSFSLYQKFWPVKSAMITLLGLTCGRLFVVEYSEKTKGNLQATLFAGCLFLLLFTSVLYLGTTFVSIEAEKMPVTLLEIGSTFLLSLIGLVAGIFLGGNKKFTAWISGFHKDFIEAVSMRVARLENKAFHMNKAAQGAFGSVFNFCRVAMRGGMLQLLKTEEGFSDRTLMERVSKGLGSLSLTLRVFHSGSVRNYLFFGMVFILIGSFLYLVV